MVICLLAPAQAMAADDQAQIEAAIRTAYQNGDDAALETAAGEFKTYLLSQHMTEQEVCNYLDNWFRTQVEGISDREVTRLMVMFCSQYIEDLNNPPAPEIPITDDQKNPSPA